jgi:hypothetical protein
MIVFYKDRIYTGRHGAQGHRHLWRRFDGDAFMVCEASANKHHPENFWMLGEGGKEIAVANVIVFDELTTPPTLLSGQYVIAGVIAECARHRSDIPPVFVISGTGDIVDTELNVIMQGPL